MTASIHSKLGFVIIAFDVCSLAFLPLLTPVAVNYPGRLPTTMETIASVTVVSAGLKATRRAKGISKGSLTLKSVASLPTVYVHHRSLGWQLHLGSPLDPQAASAVVTVILTIARLQLGDSEDR